MSRYLHLSDSNNRDAEIIFKSKSKVSRLKLVTSDGLEVKTLRVLKSAAHNTYQGLLNDYIEPENIAKALIKGDPEIDLKITGRFIKNTTRVYINNELKPVNRITKKEILYTPGGAIKEERFPNELLANISTEIALKPGKLFPKKEIYNKLVFVKKLQLHHVNGLTFHFLYEISKDLHDKDALMMIGGNAKGSDPLVFQDGGKPYRGFLEGRICGDSYILILHLTNLELKPLPEV